MLRLNARPLQTLALSSALILAARPISARTAAVERIASNDNRTTAGTMADGTLTVRLEIRAGEWHPDGDGLPGATVNAFAIEGGPLQTPGPIIRVPEGTRIRIFLRNRLDDARVFHGFYARTESDASDANPVAVPGGASREITFLAGRPGTYFYWAASLGATAMPDRPGADLQLSGALVVDPPGGSQPDRVFVISSWNGQAPGGAGVGRIVINGLSWPHTERLTYRVGERARMRLINVSNGVHPMHLHGFYFNVDSRGDERSDKLFATTSSPHMVVTERLTQGHTFSLTWIPTRPGNWLFHCHDNIHLAYGGTLDGSPSPATATGHHVENHALEMMAGPVMGITVTGTATDSVSSADPARRLRLVAQPDTGGTASDPAFMYVLEDGHPAANAPRASLPGPTIVLKRGEPVAITVANKLDEPTSVHWHGIELDSYYDGVAGFAGEGTHIAPAIAPGGSFEARFTPPRSGTFIYHAHLDDLRQQAGGLSGPLVVVDSPAEYDPRHDLVFMVTVPRARADAGVVLLNGSSTPSAIEMRAGDRYRLRLINLHVSRPSMRMRLHSENRLMAWRSVAKDGRDLPADQSVTVPAEVQMGNGETYDFEFTPSAPGDLRFTVSAANGNVLASLLIHVS